MTCWPAGCLVYRLADRTGRVHLGPLLPGLSHANAVACRFALADWPLGCWLQLHFGRAMVAALFSVLVLKSQIFAGRLLRACAIIQLSYFVSCSFFWADYMEIGFSRGKNFQCSWPLRGGGHWSWELFSYFIAYALGICVLIWFYFPEFKWEAFSYLCSLGLKPFSLLYKPLLRGQFIKVCLHLPTKCWNTVKPRYNKL